MKNSTEIWKRVIEKNIGEYEVSNMGNVRNAITGRVLKPFTNTAGYQQVDLTKYEKDKKQKKRLFLVHRLVANAFIPNDNPTDNVLVNHKDENKLNNRVDNLEWCSAYYNTRYGKLQKRLVKIDVIDSKGDVVEVVEGIRECERKYSISKYLIKQSSDGKDLIIDNKCNFNFKLAV